MMMKLAEDIEPGDELVGYDLLGTLERRRVVRVSRFANGDLLVTWDLGGHVSGGDVFGPDQVVTEYADVIEEG